MRPLIRVRNFSIFRMISRAALVQVDGLAIPLLTSVKSRIACFSSGTLLQLPRVRASSSNWPSHPSTLFVHDDPVSVK